MAQPDSERPSAAAPHVLLVDDDPYFIQLLDHQLRGLGVSQLRHASSGGQALFELNQAPQTELILCDLQMPTMNGVEFLHQLEYLGYTGSVILVSGEEPRVLQSVAELVQAYGMSLLGALSKPVDRGALQALLSRCHHTPAAGAAAADPPPRSVTRFGWSRNSWSCSSSHGSNCPLGK